MIKRNVSLARLLSLLLALALIAGLGGCARNEEESSAEPDRPSRPSSVSSGSSVSEDGGPEPWELISYKEDIAQAQNINEDVVGWLMCPGTSIDEYVLIGPDNFYYLRKDIEKRYSQSGVYYADFRCTFGSSAKGLSRNTVIYGHALDMNDSPDAPYFSQLKRYLDEDFAREHPYIYFSVAEEDMVWEVFAVFYTTIALDYIQPDPTNEEFLNLISEVNKRNEYLYDINISTDDKILTLSTCTYQFTPGVYPNDYRYVVMARLVPAGEELKETASLEKNPSPKDP